MGLLTVQSLNTRTSWRLIFGFLVALLVVHELLIDFTVFYNADKEDASQTMVEKDRTDSKEEVESSGNDNSTQSLLLKNDSFGVDATVDIGYIERHSVHMDLLDLVDWETKSLAALTHPNATQNSIHKGCVPNPGTPSFCCLGARSTGGRVNIKYSIQCSQSMKLGLDSILEDAREYLAKTRSQLLGAASSTSSSEKDPWECDVCRIVEIARLHNLTIAFVGDSMQTQVFYGLICELRRRNYDIDFKTDNRNPKNPWGNSKISLVDQVTVKSDEDSSRGVARFEFRMVYMLDLAIESEEEEIMNLGDVLITSWGLHWWFQSNIVRKKPASYTRSMTNFFKNATVPGSRIQMLVHREVSAQHFANAPGGLFSLGYV